MLGEIFKALFIPSLAGSALAAVIAFTKPITKKIFGYSWHYYIWLCVLFVMLMPVRFNVKAPIVPSISTQTVQTEQAVTDEKPQTAENIVQADTAQKPYVLQKATVIWDRIMYNRMNILAYLWLVGSAVLLFIYIIGYIRLICKMHKNSAVVSCPELAKFTDKRVTVRVWKNTSTPFMVGIFKPTLVLPDGELTEEQLDNIIRHEMTHFKRHDILYKWFAELVKCVHWFNPVIWYVSKQIAAECEISCDMAVTKNMTGTEEMSYINTILSLLPKDKSNRLSLTTQMASSKKILKRRFIMIKNKKTTSRFMSVLSAVIAVIMLSTTVFASGVLSDMTTDDYTIQIANNDEKIELKNKPFIENGEVYLPLRELFEKVGVMEHPDSKIEWNNGKIDLCIAFYTEAVVTSEHQSLNNGQGVETVSFIYKYAIEIEKSILIENIVPNHILGQENSNIENIMKTAPLLKGSNTYIPYSYVRRILDTQKWNISYAVYDKNGNQIDDIAGIEFVSPSVVKTSKYDNTTPEYTIDQFFYSFGTGDFENMKRYCTQNCTNTFFKDDAVFGMKKANLTEMDINPLEYAKSSNGFNVFVSVNMTPSEESVFDPSETSTSFYVILQRQTDGRYLIDEFATGL